MPEGGHGDHVELDRGSAAWRSRCWLVIPAMVGMLTFAISSGYVNQFWAERFRTGPRAEFPLTIELGTREAGEVARASFSITNKGKEELVVQDLRTDCACAGVEQLIEGKMCRVESLHIAPGEAAVLSVRVAVNGQAEAPMRSRIDFRTNDAAHPNASLFASVSRVTAGVTTLPTAIDVGALRVGAEYRQILEVCDTADPPRWVEKVESTSDERIRVRLLPAVGKKPQLAPILRGTLIALVEVVVVGSAPGPLSGSVHITLAGTDRKPDSVRISGRFAADVEAFPAKVVLPKLSAGGPVYSATCLCRSLGDVPLALTLQEASVGVTAEADGAEEQSGTRIVRITCDPKQMAQKPGQGLTARFRARCGDREVTLVIPVEWRAGGSP